MIRVIPAINEEMLTEAVKKIRLAEKFSGLLDIDISDGVFSPRKTITLQQLASRDIRAKLNIHFMGVKIRDVLSSLPLTTTQFTFHQEACLDNDEVRECIDLCKKKNITAYIGLAPDTKISELGSLVEEHNFFHLLTVYPGKSGQSLLPAVLRKINHIKAMNPHAVIGIDGGVNLSTISLIQNYPLDYVSATSAIFAKEDPKAAFEELQRKLNTFN